MKKIITAVAVVLVGFSLGFFGILFERLVFGQNGELQKIVRPLSDKFSQCVDYFKSSTMEEELSFKDNSKLLPELVQASASSLPRVNAPTINREELMKQKDIALCETQELLDQEEIQRYAETGIMKVTKITANITTFAGPTDKGVKKLEKGSVSGRLLRGLDTKKVVMTAWPMPYVAMNEACPLPFVEELFSPDRGTLKQRIEQANKSLSDYMAEFTVWDKYGNRIVVLAQIEDRGPASPTRWDASCALWEALGLTKTLEGSPNKVDNRVTFEVRLVPKGVKTKTGDKDLMTSYYGSQGESEEEDVEFETQFSSNGGEEFALPSWDIAPENTVASNP